MHFEITKIEGTIVRDDKGNLYILLELLPDVKPLQPILACHIGCKIKLELTKAS